MGDERKEMREALLSLLSSLYPVYKTRKRPLSFILSTLYF